MNKLDFRKGGSMRMTYSVIFFSSNFQYVFPVQLHSQEECMRLILFMVEINTSFRRVEVYMDNHDTGLHKLIFESSCSYRDLSDTDPFLSEEVPF